MIGVLASIVLIFTLGCEFYPKEVSRFNSNAWSSKLEWNWGPCGFEFQNVLYDVYHTAAFCRYLHWTLLFDAICWLWSVHRHLGDGWYSLFAIALILQTYSYAESRLVLY